MRLVFLGTPVDAVAPLRAVVEAGHEVALVLTQPDRRRSRGGGDDPSPVKQAATELGIPVLTPTRARKAIADVAATGAQLGVVVGFGQLLPPAFLDALPHGFVNLHYSLLPRWRGAAPVERAILAGDTETGVCLMRIEEGLDTGGIYASVSTPIEPEETAGELRARLTALGTRLLVEHLPLVPRPSRFRRRASRRTPRSSRWTSSGSTVRDRRWRSRASSAPGTRDRAHGWSSTGSASRSGAPGPSREKARRESYADRGSW